MFVALFSIIIFLSDKYVLYTTVAFILGSITSIVSGYIGMYVATRCNVRVTYCAAYTKGNAGEKLSSAFIVAFRGGCVMGFILVALALSVLTLIIGVYLCLLAPSTVHEFTRMFEYIAGYGLGGSSVALFCRVGGGIYTKAADVGADLVGKVVMDLDEDDPRNPAVIADNVGDNVGDIAGMGADLFGSFAESTCAALVVSGTSELLTKDANFMYPLILSASGILVCILTSFFATHIMSVTIPENIENTLKYQLIISTILLLPTIYLVGKLLPPEFEFVTGVGETKQIVHSTSWGVTICAGTGLIAGLVIGYFTDYYTSNAHGPTQELARACTSGAAINIIHGLALGYLSCIVPIIAIAGI